MREDEDEDEDNEDENEQRVYQTSKATNLCTMYLHVSWLTFVFVASFSRGL